jgi:hypothetical protein
MSRIDIAAIRGKAGVTDVLAAHGVPVRGRRARCPVHSGGNPDAFSISADGRFWRCWSCGAHGDVIDLERRLGGGGFVDAASRLAGGKVPTVAPAEAERARVIAARKRTVYRWRARELDRLADQLCDLDDDLDLVRGALRIAHTRGFEMIEIGLWRHYEGIIRAMEMCEWRSTLLDSADDRRLIAMWRHSRAQGDGHARSG